MKKIPLMIVAFILAGSLNIQAQGTTRYFTTSGELIMSFADIKVDGTSQSGNIIRFSPWFNLKTMYNMDFSDHFGVYAGLGVRNVGFIYEDTDTKIKKKYRTYNVGVPVGIKVGNLDGFFAFGGYELEVPFNYKEKTFINESKDNKFNVWFSDRTNIWNSTVFGGIHFPYGATLTFKYYLTNFFNKDFEEVNNGVTSKPYEFVDANVFYISLSFAMFKNKHFVPEDYF